LSFLPVCCAGIRLARFNVGTDPDIPTKYFVGLPTTVAALMLAGFIFFAQRLPADFDTARAAAALTVFMSLLMVSEVHYEKSNILSLRYIRKTRRFITGLVILASLILLPDVAFFGWGLLYIMYGAARSLLYTLRYGGDNARETEMDDLCL
jgi:CDP-diacylglycerol--serine O-phosphatidyltransferase